MIKKFRLEDTKYSLDMRENGQMIDCRVTETNANQEEQIFNLEFASIRIENSSEFEFKTNTGHTKHGHYLISNGIYYVHLEGKVFELIEEKQLADNKDVSGVYCSPMPGKVLQVSVEIGTIVNEGDPLLVIEAMKMENIIIAKSAGKIKEMNCSVGDLVDPEQTLIVVEAT